MLNEAQKAARFRSQNGLFGVSRGRVEVETVTPTPISRARPGTSPLAAGGKAGRHAASERLALNAVTEAEDIEHSNEPFTMYSYPLDNYELMPTDSYNASAPAVRSKLNVNSSEASTALSPSVVSVAQS